MNEDISKAVAVFRTSPNLEDYVVYQTLVADGVERQRAARLVEFLPIIYSRLILRNSGARFSNTFRRTLPGGTSYEQQLSSEPIWDAAVAFAYVEAERGVSSQDILAVAARSAEFDAANQLLNKGSKLENVAFTPPVLNWPESGPDAETPYATSQQGPLQ
jgi:hypothetical protein